MKNLLVGASVILLLSYISICYFFSSLIILPQRRALEDPAELIASYGPLQEVSFRTNDNLTLKGWLFENPKDSTDCGVIMLHGHNSNRFGMRRWMSYFWVKGCDVLLYDHRAHGESEGTFATFGIRESEDVLSAHDFLKEKTGLKDQNIGWVGASWGAAAALYAGAEKDELSFILADSPYKDFDAAVMERAIRDFGEWVLLLKPMIYFLVEFRADINIAEASTLERARQNMMPVLLIHSQTDQATSSDQSVAIAAVMNPENLIFHHTDWGSLHCKDLENFPERYWQMMDEFSSKMQLQLW